MARKTGIRRLMAIDTLEVAANEAFRQRNPTLSTQKKQNPARARRDR